MPSMIALTSTTLLALGFVVGCSAPVVDDVADANGAQTRGIVLVDRSGPIDGPTKTLVSAKFMRTQGADAEVAERMVGAHLELPAVGECRSVAAAPEEDEARSLNAITSIELLDVGDMTMRASGSVLPLAARAFPDIGGDLVSGVFYTSRDAASDLPAPAHYEIESSGSVLLDRFAVQVDAPSAPQDVRLGEDTLGEGVLLAEGVSPVFHWRAGQDLVYVDISSAATGAEVRCTFADAGEGTVPWRALGNTFGALPASVSLTVHRVRHAAFSAPGVDFGEVRFDLAIATHALIASSQAR